jgi:hypothetical protein
MQPELAEAEALLVGHRIVAVSYPDLTWSEWRDGELTLDDGTFLEVRANQGCGGCTAGWYEVSHLATCDNVITAVRLASNTEETRFELFVITANEEIRAFEVTGSDNGYYGSGYTLSVKRKELT